MEEGLECGENKRGKTFARRVMHIFSMRSDRRSRNVRPILIVAKICRDELFWCEHGEEKNQILHIATTSLRYMPLGRYFTGYWDRLK